MVIHLFIFSFRMLYIFKDHLEKLVAKFSNCLLKEEQDFLTKFSFLTSNFYRLPKFNKSKIIQEAIQTMNILKYMNPQI